MRRDQLSKELAEELALHLEMKGCSDNRFLEMGNITLAREESRDMWGFVSIDDWLKDTRYALRIFRKSPGFALIAIFSLALGIAGNTAIFSIINGLLIRPLPYEEPQRLVRITEFYPKAIFERFQQRSRTMDIAFVSPGTEVNLTGAGPASRMTGCETSTNFFSVMGTNLIKGRAFQAGEQRPGNDGVVVLSGELWRSKFDGDPNVIGQSITLGGINRQVIGIAPPGFSFPSAKVQFWIPARMDPGQTEDYWGGQFVPLIGRLHEGATIEQARREIQALASQVWSLFPWPMPRRWNANSTVISLQSDLAGDAGATLLTLLGAVGALLLIACANVASLLLARATARRKEIAMRAALGAGTGRIVRQLLTESMLLSVAAGALGIVFGAISISLFRAVVPAELLGSTSSVMDWRVCAFAAGLSLLTGLAFGIVPALDARKIDLVEVIRSGSQRFTTQSSVALRNWLIGGEIALTVVLVVGAGLLMRSLYDLTAGNPGFNSRRVVTVKVSPNESLCQRREACVALYARLLERARSVSGVTAVAAANTVPLDGELPAIAGDIEDHPRTADFPAPMLWAGAVSTNYFRLMQIPLISGRVFSEADAADSAPVIVISAATARRFWPHVNPIGKHIRRAGETRWRTIIGVVADVHQFNLANHAPSYLKGAIYMPYAQADINGQLPAVMELIVKTGLDVQTTGTELRRIAADLNPDVPVGKAVSLTEMLGDSISDFRSTSWIFVVFAATALILAAIGLYGLLSYTVSQRTFEISVRMAIGASASEILGLILSQGLHIALIGILVGIAGSAVLTRFLASMLYGVSALDPLTLAAVSALLLAVTVLASAIPAYRALRIDPIRTLRAE